MTATFARLRAIWNTLDTEPVELLLACLGIVWGAWLASPFWPTYRASPTWAAVASFGPEWVWGSTVVAVSALWLVGLLAELPRVRGSGQVLSVWIWIFLWWAFVSANWQATATVVYGFIAVACAWCRWRLGPVA